jgi:hypothetical protein
MKKTVAQLREGWYGTFGAPEGHDVKTPVDCGKLYETAIKYANSKFITMCNGSITGTIGALEQDPSYKPPLIDIPIDTLLLDFQLPGSEQQEEDEQQQQQQE